MEKKKSFFLKVKNGKPIDLFLYGLRTNLGILGIVYGVIVSYGLSFYNQF